MDSGNVVIDSDMAYPILFIPKKCTTLETNCELTDNVYIDVSITSPDTEGNNTNIYNGFCNVKLVDSYDVSLNRLETPESSTAPDIDQMPVILSEGAQYPQYSQSQVWIDPSRSPYVYNHYNPSNQEQYSIRESGGLITVEQHNTYITQNVYNCKESNVYNYKDSSVKDFECKRYRKEAVTSASDTNLSYYEEDEFECGVFLSQLPEEILNEKQTRAREERNFPRQQENNALKQLMSSDIQSTSKQRKTILFLGNDSHSGHTIQNISYNDPLVKCAEIEVDNEVVIDTSSPSLKKKYQCDKCKQIFDQISSFRQHMVGNHTNFKLSQPAKEMRFICTECGKNLKTLKKFELHCLGHGDPDLECPKCRKVFASKFSLRVHMKIHSRKYSCNFCIKSYGNFLDLKTHVEKIHFLFMCGVETCSFVSGKASDLEDHQHWNKTEVDEIEVVDTVINDPDEIDDPDYPEETELKSEVIELDQDLMISSQFMRSTPDLSMSNHDLAMSNRDCEMSNEDCEMSNQDLPTSNQNLAISNQDLPTSNQNLAISKQELAISIQDLTISNQDLAMSNQNSPTSNQNLAISNQDLAMSNEDLTMSNQDLVISNEDLAMSNQDLVMSNQDLVMSNQELAISNQDLALSNQDLPTSILNLAIPKQDLVISNQDLAVSNQNLALSNEDLAGSSNDLLRSSLNLARSHDDLLVENDGDRIRKADSVIAKVMSNTIFLLSTKKARKHRCRRACEVCLKPFDRIDDLKRHLIEHVIRSTLAKTPVSRSGCLKIICEVCQTATFQKVDKYKAHLREHAKLTIYKCTFCDKTFSDSSNFSKHKKIHGVSYFQCDLCNRKFNSKKMIAQHMDYHRTHLPIDCTICNKTFHFASMLNKHSRCAHRKEGTSKYRCRFCDDIFMSLKEKWDHEWRVHSVRKMIVDCLICGSKYRKYSELKRHCIEEHEMDIPQAKKLMKKRFARKISFD